jgi:hypothetical protein
LLAAVAVILVLGDSGDATGSPIAIAGVGLLTFVVAMLGVRSRVTDHGLHALLIASAVAVAAAIVITTVRLSGMPELSPSTVGPRAKPVISMGGVGPSTSQNAAAAH